MQYAAVITAGGRVDAAFAAEIGTDVKALAAPAGTTMVDAAIAALRECGIERIALVGGDEVRERCAALADRFISERKTGEENQRLALRAWEEDVPLLYLTSDMPFINATALRAYLEHAPAGAISMPLCEFDDFARRFPDAPPFGIALGAERVVNGGVFALPAGAAGRVEDLALRFFTARKSPLAMARLTGLPLLLRFLFRRLNISAVEARATGLLGIPAVGVRGAPPELAYDVDTLQEYRYAARALQALQPSSR